jgi:hypothetical protein
MIKYHTNSKGIKVAEILIGSDLITSPDDILDLMAEASFNESTKIIIYSQNLHPDFFDLKSRLAGEILQKFSNYRMGLAIIGNFSNIKSKSLNDFIRESNKWGTISFVDTLEKALL